MAMTSEHRTSISRHLRTVFGAGAIGSLPDRQLLERFLAGRGDDDSASAFAALVERHGPMVLGVCHHALGHLHDAEDAAQATFLVLAKRAGSIRRADSLASWLFGVALKVSSKSRARSAHRRAIERKGAEMRALDAGPEMPPEGRSELYEELDRLPERFRAPIVLCHLEGLTNEQAASQLGLPLRTVQRRLSEGRERLRRRLERLGLAPASATFPLGWGADAASEAWIEATVRAANGVAAGRAVDAVASASVAALARAALATAPAARLKAVAAGSVVAVGLGALAGSVAPRADGPQARPPAPAKARGVRQEPFPAGRTGSWIRGLVVDERGRPVGGARVSIHRSADPPAAITRADGVFALPSDQPRLLHRWIFATADGGALQGIFRFDGSSGLRTARTLIRVTVRPAREVAVAVVDGRGEPVPGASVFAVDDFVPIAEAATDARGSARLRLPSEAMLLWIVAHKPGVGFDYFENYPSGPKVTGTPPPRAARLVLDGARTARVRVVDSAGRPVPGVELVPTMTRKPGKLAWIQVVGSPIKARTDAEGVAIFDGLPADPGFRTGFWMTSRSYFLPRPPWLDAEHPDVIVTARVLRKTPVSGKVTRPDGSPAAGILIEAVSAVGPGHMVPREYRARTAADGSYTMDLPPGHAYLIAVVDDEWAAPSLGGVVVREGVPRAGLDLTLARGVAIRGRVTVGPDARPAPGESATLVELGPEIPRGTFPDQEGPLAAQFHRVSDTDEDGRYAFRVWPGTYYLHGPGAPVQPGPNRLKIGAGQEIERDFHLDHDGRPPPEHR